VARIRTIKPEFPQSESMGRVSREARLLFVMLWPICDDHGRTRAASRMLASLLFPYDDDAPALIDGWLDELEREGCIERYESGGSTYLHIPKWLTHQKIDKPSNPVHPEPPRGLANPREGSALEGKGREGKGEEESRGIAPKGAISLAGFLEQCKAEGVEAIPADDPIYAYADKLGLPSYFIALAWSWFKVSRAGKKYKDWRAHFRDAVRGNWPKYWYEEPGGGWALTTAGKQAMREQGP